MSKDETFKGSGADMMPDYARASMGHNTGNVQWTSLRAIINTAAVLHQAAVDREKAAKIDRALVEVIGFLPNKYIQEIVERHPNERERIERLGFGYKLS